MGDRTLQVGVKAVITDDQHRVLLLKRSEPFHGEDVLKWDIPGGRIDAGEELLDALKREVKEETGLDVTSVSGIFHVQDILFNPKLHVVRVTYAVHASGDVRLSEEHVDHRWAPKDELPLDPTDIYFVDAIRANGWIT
jgi:ADP-ribose pyrophosphatase YjhB (NUDIX family)